MTHTCLESPTSSFPAEARGPGEAGTGRGALGCQQRLLEPYSARSAKPTMTKKALPCEPSRLRPRWRPWPQTRGSDAGCKMCIIWDSTESIPWGAAWPRPPFCHVQSGCSLGYPHSNMVSKSRAHVKELMRPVSVRPWNPQHSILGGREGRGVEGDGDRALERDKTPEN